MRLNELMIGDWVRVPSELNRYMRIRSTFDMDSAILYEPIPLTPEILEKNGFEKYQEDRFNPNRWVCIQDGNRGDVTIEISFYQPPIFDVDILTKIIANCSTGVTVNTVHNCDIKAVHQLQHALRLCGIEKEIEL